MRAPGGIGGLLAGVLAGLLAGDAALAQPAGEAPAPAAGPVLEEFERDFDRYEEAAGEHHQRMRSILLREFDERKKELEERYARKLSAAKDEKARRQLEAKALLEKFVREHPDHEQFTPDAMFRLADLYLDEAEEKVEESDITEGLVADYSEAIALWEQILDQFPAYRQTPETLYLLAYYGNIDDPRRSLLLYLSLACANKFDPKGEPPPALSRDEIRARIDVRELSNPYDGCEPIEGADAELVRHAWVRGVGDHHFQEVELDEAIAAYEHVAGDDDAVLHAETVYKLAWSYYRRDFLEEAIALFDRSVKVYDETVARGESPKLELREEALQYLAISFTDPWEGESQTDPQLAFQRTERFYEGRNDEEHVRDVWVVMGDAFMELGAHEEAARAYYKAVNDPWHLHPDNPQDHLKIVRAYRSIDAEDPRLYAAAEEIGTRYAPGSDWARANAHNRRAMQNQRELARDMLLDAAKGLMNQGIAMLEQSELLSEGDPAREAMRQDADEAFGKAVSLYQRFIEEYPDSSKVYEASYYLAESQRATGEFAASINNYRFVIENHEHAPGFFQDAAKSMVAAYDAWVEAEQDAGNLEPIKLYSRDELAALEPFEPKQMPQLYREQQQAWDWYMTLVSEPGMASAMGLNAAKLSYSYVRLDDAAERYEKVMKRFCGKSEAAMDNVLEAKDTLLNIYEARGQDDRFKAVNDSFINNGCGDADAIKLAEQQNRNLDFNRSTERLESAGDTEDPEELVAAAEDLYRYYRSQPKDDANVATALYNAAIAYRKAGRPKTSLYLIDQFLDEDYKSSPYYTQAYLVRAQAYQDMYEYGQAADTYLELRSQTKSWKRNGLEPPPGTRGDPGPVFDQVALDALWNAARMRELERSFKQAVQLYTQYERETADPDEKEEALWSAARSYKSAGDIGNLAKTYDLWRRRYGKDHVDRYVQTYYDVAKLFEKKGRSRDADRWRKQTIDAWERKGNPPHEKSLHEQSAARMAGEFELLYAEQYFKSAFVPYAKHEKQVGKAAQLQRVRDGLDKVTKQALDKYAELVDRYQYPIYTLAALVRMGEVHMRYGTKWSQIPPPKELEQLNMRFPEEEFLLQYEQDLIDHIEKQGCPKVEGGKRIPRGCTDAAKEAWSAVVNLAQRNKLSNEWVRLARENLASEFPDQFDFQHAEIVEGTEDP